MVDTHVKLFSILCLHNSHVLLQVSHQHRIDIWYVCKVKLNKCGSGKLINWSLLIETLYKTSHN